MPFWRESFRGDPITATQVLALCETEGLLADEIGSKDRHSRLSRIGHALHGKRDHAFGSYLIKRTRRQAGKTHYRLIPAVGSSLKASEASSESLQRENSQESDFEGSPGGFGGFGGFSTVATRVSDDDIFG